MAATANEHEVVADVHAGRLGDAGVAAGAMVSHAGDAVSSVDADKGAKLQATGQEISDGAEQAKTAAKTIRDAKP